MPNQSLYCYTWTPAQCGEHKLIRGHLVKKTNHKVQAINLLGRELASFQDQIDGLKHELDRLRIQHERYQLYVCNRRLTPPVGAIILRMESRLQECARMWGGVTVHLSVRAFWEIQPGQLHWCVYTRTPRLKRKTRFAAVIHPLIDQSRDIARLKNQLQDLQQLVRNKFGFQH